MRTNGAVASPESAEAQGTASGAGGWRAGGPTGFDRVLALSLAIGLPFAAARLLDVTGGAAMSLLLYYGVGSLLVPMWRRGSLGYDPVRTWPWSIFGPALLLPMALAAIDLAAPIPVGPLTPGFWLTLLVWVPLNGALEHLGWFYVLDAWRDGWSNPRTAVVGTVVGAVLMLAFVGAIHALFWGQFLPTGSTWPRIGIGVNALLLLAYVLLRDRTRSQWPVFALHALVDLQLVLVARYSILPDL